jgi:hypothetical protein
MPTNRPLTRDEEGISESYADNTHTEKLRTFLDNQEELDRLNKHRNTNWDMDVFNAVIEYALQLREEG